jgi:Fic family protein
MISSVPSPWPADDLGRNMGSAALFFDRLMKLPEAERSRISTGAIESPEWENARQLVQNAFPRLIPESRKKEVREAIGVATSSFSRAMDPVLARLGVEAVRAMLVRHAPGLADAVRKLYEPFENVIPLAAIQPPPAANAVALFDPRQLDAQYKPFPSFPEWSDRAFVDEQRWESYVSRLPSRDTIDPAALMRAREVVARATAYDTGALEGLYDANDGITFTVAFAATAALAAEAVGDAKGPRVRALFEAQLAAYDDVLDVVTAGEIPIPEAWIRQLHASMCRDQDTYQALTPQGPQEQVLPKGEYKHHPNHVRTPDGKYFAYAPVDLTPAEMQRFVEELRSPAFEAAHAALQASYAHYAFVRVHPFADGNGRVARALASIYTYRAVSVPLMILFDKRAEYLGAIRAADAGDYQPFVSFAVERVIDAVLLAAESLASSSLPGPDEQLKQLQRTYTTRGGYTHVDVDMAGYRVFDAFRARLSSLANSKAPSGKIEVKLQDSRDAKYPLSDENHRAPVAKQGRWASLTLSASAPADAGIAHEFGLDVPKDAAADDDIVVRDLTTRDVLAVRVSEAHPAITTLADVRINMFAERVLSRMLAQLTDATRVSLRQKGY